MTLKFWLLTLGPTFLIDVISILLISISIGLVLTILTIRVTRFKKWVYVPKGNRWNQNTVSLHGGVAILLTFVLAVLLSSEISESNWILIILPAIISVVGLIDDIKALTPIIKLIAEIGVAVIAILFGWSFEIFDNVFLNSILTIFWIVGIINAVNLMDNMDGIATGICLMVAIYLGFFISRDLPMIANLCVILSGALLAFIVFNFHPAKIFMGDSGSLFLGTLLALVLIKYSHTIPQETNLYFIPQKLSTPVLILIVPIVDTIFVSINRMIKGVPIYIGDRGHITHRLSYLFKNDKITVISIYLYQIVVFIFLYFKLANLMLGLIVITIISLRFLTHRTNDFLKSQSDAKIGSEKAEPSSI